MKLQINKLPLDILFIIIPYTYKPQSKELQVVVALTMSCAIPGVFMPTFIDSGCYIDGGLLNNYPLKYCIRDDNTIDNKYDWISNDVTRFMNKDLPTLFCGYHQCYVDKICRLFLMKDKNKEETTNFIIKLVDNKSVTFETNLRIALLKPKERDLLVNFMRILCLLNLNLIIINKNNKN